MNNSYNTNFNQASMGNYNNNYNYSNFDEVFNECYFPEDITSPEQWSKYVYMSQRKQAFCEQLIKYYGLTPNVMFKRYEDDNSKAHGYKLPMFDCVRADGTTVRITFMYGGTIACTGYIDPTTGQAMQFKDGQENKIFVFNEQEMMHNDFNNNKVGYNFQTNELSILNDGQASSINIFTATDNDRQKFVNSFQSNQDLYNNYNNYGYNYFMQGNYSVEQPYMPMFNYCQGMGFYPQYNDQNSFANMYNQCFGYNYNNFYNEFCKYQQNYFMNLMNNVQKQFNQLQQANVGNNSKTVVLKQQQQPNNIKSHRTVVMPASNQMNLKNINYQNNDVAYNALNAAFDKVGQQMMNFNANNGFSSQFNSVMQNYYNNNNYFGQQLNNQFNNQQFSMNNGNNIAVSYNNTNTSNQNMNYMMNQSQKLNNCSNDFNNSFMSQNQNQTSYNNSISF